MKKKNHSVFFIDCVTFDTENTSSVSQNVAAKCADSVLFDMEKATRSNKRTVQLRTGAMNTIGDISFFVLNISQSRPKYNQPHWRC